METEKYLFEEWRDVPGFVGYYQASNLGRVKSLDRYVRQKNNSKALKKGRILKPKITYHGYYEVSLTVNRKQVYYRKCRLIYLTFKGPIPDGLQVNHINENKLDDRPENLNLKTPKDNSNWGTRNTRISITRGKPILQLNKNGEIIGEFHSAREAARQLGINSPHIVDVCNGKRKTAGGYIWKYKKEA